MSHEHGGGHGGGGERFAFMQRMEEGAKGITSVSERSLGLFLFGLLAFLDITPTAAPAHH